MVVHPLDLVKNRMQLSGEVLAFDDCICKDAFKTFILQGKEELQENTKPVCMQLSRLLRRKASWDFTLGTAYSLFLAFHRYPINWFIAKLLNWAVKWSIDWLLYRLIDWLLYWSIDWLLYWLIDWLFYRLIALLIDWLLYWVTDWLIDRLIDWLICGLIDCLIDIPFCFHFVLQIVSWFTATSNVHNHSARSLYLAFWAFFWVYLLSKYLQLFLIAYTNSSRIFKCNPFILEAYTSQSNKLPYFMITLFYVDQEINRQDFWRKPASPSSREVSRRPWAHRPSCRWFECPPTAGTVFFALHKSQAVNNFSFFSSRNYSSQTAARPTTKL